MEEGKKKMLIRRIRMTALLANYLPLKSECGSALTVGYGQ